MKGNWRGPYRKALQCFPLHARAPYLHMETHLVFGINKPGLSRNRKGVSWKRELNENASKSKSSH